jgi:hypothetical protein
MIIKLREVLVFPPFLTNLFGVFVKELYWEFWGNREKRIMGVSCPSWK